MAERILKDIDFYKKLLTNAKENNNRAEEGRASSNLGNAYDSLCDFRQAIEYHKQHLCISKEVGDRAGEGRAYGNLGNSYNRLSDFQKAIEYHNLHLSIAREMGDRAVEGGIFCNLGVAYRSLGEFRQAKEYHKQQLKIAEEVGDRAGEGKAYCGLGNAYQCLGEFQEAMKQHKRFLSVALELGDRAGEGLAYCNLGIAFSNLGKLQQAKQYHEQHLLIAKELGDRAQEGRAYGNLGITCMSLGDSQQAIKYHKERLSIAKEVGDKAGEGRAYGNLGNTYHSLGDFQQAVDYHKQELSLAMKVGDKAAEGRVYCNLGICYKCLGDFQRAIEYHELALSIAEKAGNRAAKGRAYCNLGICYKCLGDFQQAIHYHKKSLDIAEEIGDRASEANAYGNLANAYLSSGNFEEAIEHHKEQLSLAEEMGDKNGEGSAYGGLGNCYQCLGKLKEAIECHTQHLSISKKLGNRAAEGTAYCNLANAYNCRGDLQRGIEYYKQSLIIDKETGNRAGAGRVYCNLGICYLVSDSLNQALEHFRCSVETYETIRADCIKGDEWKISFRELCKTSYTYLWNVLIKLQRTDEALYAAERGRAQALVDTLEIVYGFKSPSQKSNEFQEVVTYISRKLSAQTVFLASQEDRINLWVLGKKSNAIFRQVKLENPFTDLLNRFLESIGACHGVRCENRSFEEEIHDPIFQRGSEAQRQEPPHDNSDCFEPLYNILIGPIKDLLDGDELIIVPDGSLSLAPWAALSECLRIRTVPSLTSLRLITDCPHEYHNKSGVLLVGDPCLEQVRFKGKPYEKLQYAREEVKEIGKILNSQPLIGEDATKQAVLSGIQSVALIHIAAHGNPKTGEIALAPNPGWKSKKKNPEVEYILKLSDIQAVRMRARLVVLSCCHSGKGEVKSEGVVGIARAFLFAGARSVMVSLWAIDDEATMEYMKSFYQHLKDGESASVALQKAVKCLRDSKRFSAPKYWAPFVLIGDDVTIQFDENH